MYSVVIRNGQIVDGCGNPWFRADIGIRDGRIAFIGRIDGDAQDGAAQRVVDATGLIVAPGFVDIHTHSDTTVLSCPTADSKFTQGITTEVGGNCGYSLHPVTESHQAALEEFLSIFPGKREYTWRSAAGFLDEVSRVRPSGNFATLIGHSAIRLAVKGWDKSPATPGELEQMEKMAEQGLEEGCVGVSFGLPYPPGSFASDEELLRLMMVAARKSKLVTVHVRDEADHCVESVKWVIDVARKTGAAVEISHLKSMGKPNWGKVLRSLEIISDARASGVDITVDVYPYVAINTTLTSLLPGDVISGGIDKAEQRLRDPAVFSATVDHLARNAGKYGGWENVIVASVSNMPNPAEVEGLSIKEIAGKWGKSPEETAIRIATASRGSTMIVCFSMSEDDVIAVYKAPFSMAGSDGKILSTSGPLSAGRPHPRNYGAFPRIISWLVREKKALTLEEAIRKMTSLPAQRMSFRDRGSIRPGNWADLTIFSLDEIRDMATFKAPHQYSSGIKYMLVNGEVSLENDQITGRAGQVLR